MLTNIYNETVTVFNKLRRPDSIMGKDVWHKTVISDAAWYRQSERDINGTSAVIGTYKKVLIPFHDNFLRYIEWKTPGNQEGHYTISVGDYVVLGLVEEEITGENIVNTLEKYGDNVCLVKHYTECHDRFGAHVQLSIEGV